MTEFRTLSPAFSVAAQLRPEDIARAAALGFKTLINNRPDGESPDQMPSAAARAAAEAAGMTYLEAPFAGPPSAQAIARTVEWLSHAQAPILAYCRSGTRSTTVWAMAQAQLKTMKVDDIISAAASAGYDLSGARAILQQLAAA